MEEKLKQNLCIIRVPKFFLGKKKKRKKKACAVNWQGKAAKAKFFASEKVTRGSFNPV